MKNYSFSVLAFITLLTIGFSSCKEDPIDPCADITCQNGGTCTDGTCDCPSGYEGTLCETKETAKFLGTFNVAETCPSNYSYTCTVTESPSFIGRIIFSDFYRITTWYGIATKAYANVSGNTFNIPNQTLTNGAFTFVIEGSGVIGGSHAFSVTFTVDDGTNAYNCTADYSF